MASPTIVLGRGYKYGMFSTYDDFQCRLLKEVQGRREVDDE